MKVYLLTHHPETTFLEISELLDKKSKVIGAGVVELDVNKEELVKLAYKSQSFRRSLISLGNFSKISDVEFDDSLKDLLVKESIFKVDVEGVKGNENRIEISKQVAEKVFAVYGDLKIDVKKPELLLVVFFDGKKYYLGVDTHGFEVDKRNYRVFVNPSSFKGDLAYFFVRKSGFGKDKNLVVGFVKDGVMAIEAAFFASGKAINHNRRFEFALRKLKLFTDFNFTEFFDGLDQEIKETKVSSFDESMMNIRAAKKNAAIAKVGEYLDLSKHNLDELDVRHEENSVDSLIFYLTKKDEDKLNEIYHQAKYILKQGGKLLFIAREKYEMNISAKFRLLEDGLVSRGDSRLKYWLLEKI